MSLKKLFIFITLCILIKCQNNTFTKNFNIDKYISFINIKNRLNNTKGLRSFINCVREKSSLSNDNIKIITSLMISAFTYDVNEIKKILMQNFDKILNCIDINNIPKLPDGTSLIDINKFFEIKYDWIQFYLV